MALDNTITVGSESFVRLDSGLWILSTATADQPNYLIVKSNIRPIGVSDYLIRREVHTNDPNGGPDNVLSAHMVIKGSLKAYTQTAFEQAITSVSTFLTSATLTKILRGEK